MCMREFGKEKKEMMVMIMKKEEEKEDSWCMSILAPLSPLTEQ